MPGSNALPVGNNDKAQAVKLFHKDDDVDAGVFAHHHTLGKKNGQAAPGPHQHDGFDSESLISGTISGDLTTLSGQAAVIRQMAAMLALLGATNAL